MLHNTKHFLHLTHVYVSEYRKIITYCYLLNLCRLHWHMIYIVCVCFYIVCVVPSTGLMNITVTSYDCRGVSNYHPLDCVSNDLLKQTSKKHKSSNFLALCEGNPPVARGFPHKRPVTREAFPCEDVIMNTKYFPDIHQRDGGRTKVCDENTLECRYNPVQFITTLLSTLRWQH